MDELKINEKICTLVNYEDLPPEEQGDYPDNGGGAEYAQTDKGIATQVWVRATRRAKELTEPNTLTPEQWEQIKGGQDHKCNGCGIVFSEENSATEDHIVPIGEGPGRTEGNIQALCKSCNSIKGSHSMEYLLERIKE